MTGRIRIDRAPGRHIAGIVIDNPGRRNAMDRAMAQAFTDALTELEQDDDVKVIVISGAGGNLTAGVEVRETIARFPHSDGGKRGRPLSQRARFAAANLWWGPQGLFRRLLLCPKITLVAAEGACFEAGLYLALYADLTVASETAVFGNPIWRHIGVNGDISMLIAAVGLKRAKELIYCGGEWDAADAFSYGLIDRVTQSADHEAAVAALADTCAMIMRDAVAAEKQVIGAALARMQITTGMAAGAVVAAWGTNIHFRQGEFNLLREARRTGIRAALKQGEVYFGD
jgi:enoyl-CoA hydratase/carnithine racemase